MANIKKNAILKAEVKQLNNRLKVHNHNYELYCDLLDKCEKLEAERDSLLADKIEKNLQIMDLLELNGQLREELKKSVKLPYPIDTPVYLPFKLQGVVKDRIRRWTISNKGLMFHTHGTAYYTDAIGKSVLLTYEEAENQLKTANQT